MKFVIRLFIFILLLCNCSGKNAQIYTVAQSHYEKGMQALKVRDYLTAEKELKLEIDENNQHIAAHCALGELYLKWTRLNEAERHYNKALSIDSHNTRAFIGIATIHIEKSQLNEARSDLEKVFQISNSEADAHYLLGVIELTNQNWSTSVDAFRKALEIDPHHSPAQLKLKEAQQYDQSFNIQGLNLAQKTRIKRADVAYVLAYKLSPDHYFPPTDTRIDDIDGHWADREIKFVVDLKIMDSINDKFPPKSSITKSDLAQIGQVLIVRNMGSTALQTAFLNTTSPFKDMDSNLPFYNAVMISVSYGLLEGDADGQFHPSQDVTGGDFIQFLTRAEQLSLFQ